MSSAGGGGKKGGKFVLPNPRSLIGQMGKSEADRTAAKAEAAAQRALKNVQQADSMVAQADAMRQSAAELMKASQIMKLERSVLDLENNAAKCLQEFTRTQTDIGNAQDDIISTKRELEATIKTLKEEADRAIAALQHKIAIGQRELPGLQESAENARIRAQQARNDLDTFVGTGKLPIARPEAQRREDSSKVPPSPMLSGTTAVRGQHSPKPSQPPPVPQTRPLPPRPPAFKERIIPGIGTVINDKTLVWEGGDRKKADDLWVIVKLFETSITIADHEGKGATQHTYEFNTFSGAWEEQKSPKPKQGQ